ncbi:transposase [Sphaerisporangium melleum]|uniref:transposase n=1 Tax=Sphaerisporangium melleum TaxID=321316 RepID=UPI0019526995
MARGDLTDAQWAVLEPLLPKGKKPGRPPTWTWRQLIDGIRFRVRTGSRSATRRPSSSRP